MERVGDRGFKLTPKEVSKALFQEGEERKKKLKEFMDFLDRSIIDAGGRKASRTIVFANEADTLQFEEFMGGLEPPVRVSGDQ